MAHGDPNPPRTWSRTLSWQVSACLLICLMVIGMKMINAPATQAVLDGLDYAVNTPTDFDALGKLKFIDSLIDKSAAVFNGGTDEEPNFEWPASGEIAGTFVAEDSDHRGIVIRTDAGAAVTAALDGQVFYVGENSRWGRYIRMRHADGWDTIYGHVAPSVKTGQDVLAGETLGFCVDGELLFEIWRESVPVDPLTLLPKPTGD
jgi:murein DD-endopeptidase MepM/ murein hydrolase activator NlpD